MAVAVAIAVAQAIAVAMAQAASRRRAVGSACRGRVQEACRQGPCPGGHVQEARRRGRGCCFLYGLVKELPLDVQDRSNYRAQKMS